MGGGELSQKAHGETVRHSPEETQAWTVQKLLGVSHPENRPPTPATGSVPCDSLATSGQVS